MATYNSRIGELQDLLARVTAAADDRVVTALTECIGEYSALRQHSLDDLVDLVARASMGNLGTAGAWTSRISSVRAELCRLFGNAADRVLPPPVQLFWFATVQAEDTFFERLEKVRTPQLLEDILKHQDDLSKLIGELQDGWKFVLSNNRALETDELRAISEVDDMAQGLIAELDGWHRILIDNTAGAVEAAKRKAAELKQKALEKLGPVGGWVETGAEFAKELVLDNIKPDGLPGDFDIQLDAAKQQAEFAIQSLVERIRLHRSLVQTYRGLLSAEKGGVLTMFNKTRGEVDSYVRNSDVALAKEWLDQAKGQLNDWASSLPNSRQREDAVSFRDEINKHLDNAWKITEDLDTKFRAEFQGVFISPLSNETIEKLAERYLFEKHLEEVHSRGAAGKLEEYRAQLEAHAERMEQALAPMDEVVPALPPEVQELATLRNREFRNFVRERMRRQMEMLLPTIEELKRMLEPATMNAGFSREELESMLR